MNWQQVINLITSILIPTLYPKLIPIIPFIIDAIQTAESIGGAGVDKLAKAMQLISDAVKAYNTLNTSHQIDYTSVSGIISGVISLVVNISNLIHNFKAHTP